MALVTCSLNCSLASNGTGPFVISATAAATTAAAVLNFSVAAVLTLSDNAEIHYRYHVFSLDLENL